MAAGHQGPGTPEVELYLSRGCLCARESYAKAAHKGPLLFSLSEKSIWGGPDRVLTDANDTPLLHYIEKSSCLSKTVYAYQGGSGAGGPLAFTVTKPSAFSETLRIFMNGSHPDGPPDYKLKPASFMNPLIIYRQDAVVAQAKSGCVLFQPDYRIMIFPGIDQAMAVLLVAIYDDLRPRSSEGADGGGGGGGG